MGTERVRKNKKNLTQLESFNINWEIWNEKTRTGEESKRNHRQFFLMAWLSCCKSWLFYPQFELIATTLWGNHTCVPHDYDDDDELAQNKKKKTEKKNSQSKSHRKFMFTSMPAPGTHGRTCISYSYSYSYELQNEIKWNEMLDGKAKASERACICISSQSYGLISNK